jgi:steroid delta-isomerase-like uncharacterized protein
MSVEDNKALFHRWRDAWERGDFAVIDEVIAPDYVCHLPGSPDLHGPEGDKQLVSLYRTAFPDLRFASDDLIGEEDKVVHRWTMHGTHQGDLMGIPATGKQIAVAGICIFRFAGGKIVEGWVYGDRLGLLQQLGVIPAPGQATG